MSLRIEIKKQSIYVDKNNFLFAKRREFVPNVMQQNLNLVLNNDFKIQISTVNA